MECKHDQGLKASQIIYKPYWDETQLICSQCNEVVQVNKTNNLISSCIRTQDPTLPIEIGEDIFELSPSVKKLLSYYELAFNIINIIASKLPEGQKNPDMLKAYHDLLNSCYDSIISEDNIYVQVKDQSAARGQFRKK